MATSKITRENRPKTSASTCDRIMSGWNASTVVTGVISAFEQMPKLSLTASRKTSPPAGCGVSSPTPTGRTSRRLTASSCQNSVSSCEHSDSGRGQSQPRLRTPNAASRLSENVYGIPSAGAVRVNQTEGLTDDDGDNSGTECHC